MGEGTSVEAGWVEQARSNQSCMNEIKNLFREERMAELVPEAYVASKSRF